MQRRKQDACHENGAQRVAQQRLLVLKRLSVCGGCKNIKVNTTYQNTARTVICEAALERRADNVPQDGQMHKQLVAKLARDGGECMVGTVALPHVGSLVLLVGHVRQKAVLATRGVCKRRPADHLAGVACNAVIGRRRAVDAQQHERREGLAAAPLEHGKSLALDGRHERLDDCVEAVGQLAERKQCHGSKAVDRPVQLARLVRPVNNRRRDVFPARFQIIQHPLALLSGLTRRKQRQ